MSRRAAGRKGVKVKRATVWFESQQFRPFSRPLLLVLAVALMLLVTAGAGNAADEPFSSVATISGTGVDFGALDLGRQLFFTFVVTNRATDPKDTLTITSITATPLGSTPAGDFFIGSPLLPPHVVLFEVDFKPTTV